jgi:hypothetical protein
LQHAFLRRRAAAAGGAAAGGAAAGGAAAGGAAATLRSAAEGVPLRLRLELGDLHPAAAYRSYFFEQVRAG